MGSATSVGRALDGMEGKLIDRMTARRLVASAWNEDMEQAFSKLANEDGKIHGSHIKSLVMEQQNPRRKKSIPPRQPSVSLLVAI